MEGADAETALEGVCDLYGCDAAALGRTTGELDEPVPDVDAELLFPNAGRDEEAVMAEYQEILPMQV